ncbi:Chlorate reductase subunit gamma [bacterium HR07]|nr:Chlorate reductase subunit gamma [bacterium HR07]
MSTNAWPLKWQARLTKPASAGLQSPSGDFVNPACGFSRSAIFVILLAFLGSLIAQAQAVKITAKFVNQELLPDPTAPAWNTVQPVTIALSPQQITKPFGGGAIKELQVRALHNGRLIAFLLEWADPTKDQDIAQVDRFGDGVAVQFPVDPKANPSPFMGDAQNAVNIWQWQAAWQRDMDEGGLADVERVYPPYASEVPYGIYVGRDAGNWRSQRDHKTPVENLIAQGFGTLTHQELQHVLGKGIWENGRWRVVFVRALHTGLAGDASFEAGQKNLINFAVWDGSSGERGARKSVSLNWHELTLEALPAGTTLAGTGTPAPTTKEIVRVIGVPGWVAAVLGVLGVLFGAVIVWILYHPRPQEPEIG